MLALLEKSQKRAPDLAARHVTLLVLRIAHAAPVVPCLRALARTDARIGAGERIIFARDRAVLESTQLAQGALHSKRDFPTTVRALPHQDSQEIPLLLVRLFGSYLPTQIELTVHQGRSPSHCTARFNIEVFTLAGEQHIPSLPGGRLEFPLQAITGDLMW